jgi:hypothetical protein
MANLAISHYRLGADLAHGLHFTALPTFYVAGGDKEQTISIGGASALVLADSNAKVGYAEFSGAGLAAIATEIATKENQLSALGAAIIASEIRKSETATAARIRHSGETSLMLGVVAAVEAGLEAALKFAAAWIRMPDADITVTLNDQFVGEKLDAQTVTALVAAYLAGAMTLEAFLRALQDGDLIEPKTDLAAEAAQLRRAGPPPTQRAGEAGRP